jgi:alpha-tubulin suppressor-like RCC1 family protein
VTAGVGHSCGEGPNNETYCWGANSSGALGNGTNTDTSTPVEVTGNHFFAQVSAGGHYSCGVSAEQRAYCWGHNQDGNLGDGTLTSRNTPTPVADAS